MRPTTEQSAAAEFVILTTESGCALLEEMQAVKTVTPAAIERWRKRSTAEHVAAALRLSQGRTRGEAKFTRASEMWFEPTGLEQATTEIVARHKARRFAEVDVIDACCGIGGDSLALAAVARRVLSVDRDLGMLRRTRWNASVYGCDHRLLAIQSDAERFPIPPDAMVHIDPDRRAGSRPRAKAVADYAPPAEFLRTLPDRCRGGSIKLGPASDFDALFPHRDHEAEIISLDGECKEAAIWFGSTVTCRRRATMLPHGTTWTDRDGPSGMMPISSQDSILLEPDPALGRSGLLDSFGLAHGLRRRFAGIDLLCGSLAAPSPWLTSFAILADLPMDSKAVRREVRRLGLQVREVKTRRLPEITPSSWRTDEPGEPVTLFLIRTDESVRAIMTRRVSINPPASSPADGSRRESP